MVQASIWDSFFYSSSKTLDKYLSSSSLRLHVCNIKIISRCYNCYFYLYLSSLGPCGWDSGFDRSKLNRLSTQLGDFTNLMYLRKQVIGRTCTGSHREENVHNHSIGVFLPNRTNPFNMPSSFTLFHYVIIGILYIIVAKWEVTPPEFLKWSSTLCFRTDGSTVTSILCISTTGGNGDEFHQMATIYYRQEKFRK